MRKLICTILAICCSLILRAQQVVSGMVSDGEKPLAGVAVNEIDTNGRILSSTVTNDAGLYNLIVKHRNGALRLNLKGYVPHVERMIGRKKIDIVLTKGNSLVEEDILYSKHKVEESYKLLYGHNGARNISQLISIEMLNDTLFALIVPIQSTNLSASYPAGRMLMFVDALDNPFLIARNAVEVYSISGSPEDLGETVIARYYTGSDYTPGQFSASTPIFQYPRFIFSIRELEMLLEHEAEIYRVLIDTAEGDNYWILYPHNNFGREIQKRIAKLRK